MFFFHRIEGWIFGFLLEQQGYVICTRGFLKAGFPHLMHKKLWTFGISRSVKCYRRSSHIIFNILIFSILSVYDIIISFPSFLAFFRIRQNPLKSVPAATRLPKANIFRAETGEARASASVLTSEKLRRKLQRWKNSQTPKHFLRRCEKTSKEN